MLTSTFPQTQQSNLNAYVTLTDENLHSVIARMGGDRDLLSELLSMLTAQTQVWIDECDALICRRDIAGVCRWLHTLRGTLGSLGFQDFCKKLDEIERVVRCDGGFNDSGWWVSVAEIQSSLSLLPSIIPSMIVKLHDFQGLDSRS